MKTNSRADILAFFRFLHRKKTFSSVMKDRRTGRVILPESQVLDLAERGRRDFEDYYGIRIPHAYFVEHPEGRIAPYSWTLRRVDELRNLHIQRTPKGR